MDTNTLLTIGSICVNVLLALIVYSMKTTIRVAILEAVAQIKEDYATKVDLRDVEARMNEKIGLREEIRTGFAALKRN